MWEGVRVGWQGAEIELVARAVMSSILAHAYNFNSQKAEQEGCSVSEGNLVYSNPETGLG